METSAEADVFMYSLIEMYNSRPVLTLLIAGTTIVIACDLLYEGYNLIFGKTLKTRRRKRQDVKKTSTEGEKELQLEVRKPSNLWNTVLFFPDYFPDAPDSSTQQLLNYFQSAKMSIHICMYLASHPGIGEVIRHKYAEGLLVQVVTDYDTYTAHNNCGVKHWRRSGK